jgi:hypothetical protein
MALLDLRRHTALLSNGVNSAFGKAQRLASFNSRPSSKRWVAKSNRDKLHKAHTPESRGESASEFSTAPPLAACPLPKFRALQYHLVGASLFFPLLVRLQTPGQQPGSLLSNWVSIRFWQSQFTVTGRGILAHGGMLLCVSTKQTFWNRELCLFAWSL